MIRHPAAGKAPPHAAGLPVPPGRPRRPPAVTKELA
jgi:hypothetical protein